MNIDLIAKAKEYATRAHGAVGQVRKYTGDPYIAHPAAVARLVSRVTDDPHTIAAAWLHDTLEDTDSTYADLVRAFGLCVADLVLEVSDVSVPSDGDRKTRKAIDRAHLAKASPRAMTIKLADIIDNTHAIAHHDPAFARVYMAEKQALLDDLCGGSLALMGVARSIIDGYYAA